MSEQFHFGDSLMLVCVVPEECSLIVWCVWYLKSVHWLSGVCGTWRMLIVWFVWYLKSVHWLSGVCGTWRILIVWCVWYLKSVHWLSGVCGTWRMLIVWCVWYQKSVNWLYGSCRVFIDCLVCMVPEEYLWTTWNVWYLQRRWKTLFYIRWDWLEERSDWNKHQKTQKCLKAVWGSRGSLGVLCKYHTWRILIVWCVWYLKSVHWLSGVCGTWRMLIVWCVWYQKSVNWLYGSCRVFIDCLVCMVPEEYLWTTWNVWYLQRTPKDPLLPQTAFKHFWVFWCLFQSDLSSSQSHLM